MDTHSDGNDMEILYYPDDSITSPHQRQIIARIRRFITRQEYLPGKAYISSLEHQDLADLYVVSSAISLYITQGDMSGANKMVRRLNLDELLLQPHSLLDERLAVLALQSAYIKLSTALKTSEAIALAEEVDQIYMTRICELPPSPLSLQTLTA